MAQVKKINIVPDSIPPVVKLSQYDVGRTFELNLLDGTSEYEIPSGSEVTIEGTKPSGLGFTEDCVWSGSVVTVTTTESMTDEWGEFMTEIVITKDDDRIGTTNIRFDVERSPHPDGTTDGTAEQVISTITVYMLKTEGYAVGTQYGEDVDSSSEYYHNNAKYYAELAQQAAADAGYIYFDIVDGDLYMERTSNTDVTFYLQDGDLYVTEAE